MRGLGCPVSNVGVFGWFVVGLWVCGFVVCSIAVLWFVVLESELMIRRPDD